MIGRTILEHSGFDIIRVSFYCWGCFATDDVLTIWGFPARHGGTPIAGWFVMENPMVRNG